MTSEHESPPRAVIEAVEVTKVFGGGVRALDTVSLHIRAGEVYGLVGANGAGKTTFMRVLTGLVAPSSGAIRVERPLTSGGVGSLIESPAFYPNLSGAENLRLLATYWNLPRSSASRELTRVGLLPKDQKRPYRNYSLGMKQRLGVAAALLGEPEVLVLDEPTNGLDPESIVSIRELVRSVREDGRTVLLSSHLLSEVELVADRVGVLAQGRLIAEGTLRELRESARHRRRLAVQVDDAERARSIIGALGIAQPDIRDVESGLEVLLGETEPHAVNAALVRAGIAVSSLTVVSESLESAFFELTADREPAGVSAA